MRRRTILDLIEAVFAEETLTPEETHRLYRYFPRLWLWLTTSQAVTPAVRVMRNRVLRELRVDTSPRLRTRRIRFLLACLLEFAAAWDGIQRAHRNRVLRERTRQQRGGQQSCRHRREENARLLAIFGFDRIGRRTVERYLSKQDEWSRATAEERERETQNFMRRLRRAKASTGKKRT